MEKCGNEFCNSKRSTYINDFIFNLRHTKFIYFCSLKCKKNWKSTRCCYCKNKGKDLVFDEKLNAFYCSKPKIRLLSCLSICQEGEGLICYLCTRKIQSNTGMNMEKEVEKKINLCLVCVTHIKNLRFYQEKFIEEEQNLVKHIHCFQLEQQLESHENLIECECNTKILKLVEEHQETRDNGNQKKKI